METGGGGLKGLTATPQDVRQGLTFSRDGKTVENGALNLTNLLPENIKAGVTIGGVSGTIVDLNPNRKIVFEYRTFAYNFVIPSNIHSISVILIAGAGGGGGGGSGGNYYYGTNGSYGGNGSRGYNTTVTIPGYGEYIATGGDGGYGGAGGRPDNDPPPYSTHGGDGYGGYGGSGSYGNGGVWNGRDGGCGGSGQIRIINNIKVSPGMKITFSVGDGGDGGYGGGESGKPGHKGAPGKIIILY